jgi:hypothetical protein
MVETAFDAKVKKAVFLGLKRGRFYCFVELIFTTIYVVKSSRGSDAVAVVGVSTFLVTKDSKEIKEIGLVECCMQLIVHEFGFTEVGNACCEFLYVELRLLPTTILRPFSLAFL